ALDLAEVPLRPVAHRLEDRMQAPPERRHRVLDARRDLRVEGARQEAVPLQVAELLGQHALADPGNQPAQLVEAERAPGDEGVDDGRLPLAGDDAHDQLHPLDGIGRAPPSRPPHGHDSIPDYEYVPT